MLHQHRKHASGGFIGLRLGRGHSQVPKQAGLRLGRVPGADRHTIPLFVVESCNQSFS